MHSPAPPTTREIVRAVVRAEQGKSLNKAEVSAVLGSRGPELNRLMVAARLVRDAGLVSAGRPATVTFSKKVFIPLTRLCRDRCHYCTFVTAPTKGHPAFLSPDEVLAIAEQGAALGCKEALFTLGDRPEDRWPEAQAWLEEAG